MRYLSLGGADYEGAACGFDDVFCDGVQFVDFEDSFDLFEESVD